MAFGTGDLTVRINVADADVVKTQLARYGAQIKHLQAENERLKAELEEAEDLYDWLLREVGGTI